MNSVAVVILNYNGQRLLKKFLPSVIRFTQKAQIVVADNNSSDTSREFVAQTFPQVNIIHIPFNLGFCGGYNYALKRVKADYYVLLNSDVDVTQNWIDPIINLFEQDKNIGAVQPKILSYNDKEKFEYAGAAGGFIDMLGYPFCRGRIFNAIEKDQQQYDDVAPVFWVSGACLFIRSTLFAKIGGFDEDFFAHMEEIDLCWRLHQLKYHIVYCGKSTVYHVGGATLAPSNHIKTYYNFRNGIIILIKNMQLNQLMVRLPIRVILDWVAAFKFLVTGYPLDAWAVLRAHMKLIITLRTLIHKRALNRMMLRSYKEDMIYRGSIVFDHFIMGKKSYQALKFNSER